MSSPRSTFEFLQPSGKPPLSLTISSSASLPRGTAFSQYNTAFGGMAGALAGNTGFTGFLMRAVEVAPSALQRLGEATIRAYGLETPYYTDSDNNATVSVVDAELVAVRDTWGGDLLAAYADGGWNSSHQAAVGDLVTFYNGKFAKAAAGQRYFFEIFAKSTSAGDTNGLDVALKFRRVDGVVPA